MPPTRSGLISRGPTRRHARPSERCDPPERCGPRDPAAKVGASAGVSWRPQHERWSPPMTQVAEPGTNAAATQATSRVNHWIDGRLVAGTSGREGPIYDPATGQLAKHV